MQLLRGGAHAEGRVVHVMAYDKAADRFLDVRGWHGREAVLTEAFNRWVLSVPRLDDESYEEEISRLAEADGPLWPYNEADIGEALRAIDVLGVGGE